MIIKNKVHLKQIESRNQKSKNNRFNNDKFKAIDFKQNCGELKVTRIGDEVRVDNLDDGNNKLLESFGVKNPVKHGNNKRVLQSDLCKLH